MTTVMSEKFLAFAREKHQIPASGGPQTRDPETRDPRPETQPLRELRDPRPSPRRNSETRDPRPVPEADYIVYNVDSFSAMG